MKMKKKKKKKKDNKWKIHNGKYRFEVSMFRNFL